MEHIQQSIIINQIIIQIITTDKKMSDPNYYNRFGKIEQMKKYVNQITTIFEQSNK
jgi:hypothetical protein